MLWLSGEVRRLLRSKSKKFQLFCRYNSKFSPMTPFFLKLILNRWFYFQGTTLDPGAPGTVWLDAGTPEPVWLDPGPVSLEMDVLDP